MQGFAHTLLITLSERGCMNWPKELPKPGAGSGGGGAEGRAGTERGGCMNWPQGAAYARCRKQVGGHTWRRGHHSWAGFAGALETVLSACITDGGLLCSEHVLPHPSMHAPSHPACTASYPRLLLVPPPIPAYLYRLISPLVPPDVPAAARVCTWNPAPMPFHSSDPISVLYEIT